MPADHAEHADGDWDFRVVRVICEWRPRVERDSQAVAVGGFEPQPPDFRIQLVRTNRFRVSSARPAD